MKETVARRFWAKVDQSDINGCWIWTAYKQGLGYGRFTVTHGKSVLAHRFSYEMHSGNPIPSGMLVCHKCDNPACVNPNHLFLGSSQDNLIDMKEKGRSTYGERNGRARVTESQVKTIRLLYARDAITLKALAKQYGISRVQVGRIVHGERWAYLHQQ